MVEIIVPSHASTGGTHGIRNKPSYFVYLRDKTLEVPRDGDGGEPVSTIHRIKNRNYNIQRRVPHYAHYAHSKS